MFDPSRTVYLNRLIRSTTATPHAPNELPSLSISSHKAPAKPKFLACKKPTKKCHKKKKKCCPKLTFTERSYNDIPVLDTWTRLPYQDTSLQTTYSYAVTNQGLAQIIAQIQVSADCKHAAEDVTVQVHPGETVVLVPLRFLKYTRCCLKTTQTSTQSLCNVYYQAQSNSR
ncbi:DUF6385 domain-containing protein [Paenibacillus sp. N1-5-1-14]|uniref:DUF6385 domain-containing protein n=1 Tax=Paenibacillus radicibacter TaxID=2972488 RepID=UPI0021590C07|nr:DUF6385 domain-containing protein [Paenibacillus radicibacter]MCR8642058.1 DUF6385 domain-containing protein [Paenibacillus radicibacter]